jgi:hypothetical protein
MQWSPTDAACDVTQVRLSDYVTEEVDLLKLDVEGSEWEVLDDLMEAGKMRSIRRLVIEYHHLMDAPVPRLGDFLKRLEGSGFSYNVVASRASAQYFHPRWQAVMLYAWRLDPG